MTGFWHKKMVGASLLLGLVLLGTSWYSARAQNTLTLPKPGDPLRKTLFTLLRPTVEKSAHQKVIFQVEQIHLLQGWAFLYVVPLQPSQKPLDRKKAALDPDFNGNGVAALFHKVGGAWKLVDTILWPSDVGYPDWADKYHAPKQLFVYRASK